MSGVATIYLKGPWGPNEKTWVKCYVTQQNGTGIWLNSRDDWCGDSTFWPMANVERIAYDAGW